MVYVYIKVNKTLQYKKALYESLEKYYIYRDLYTL